MGAVTHNSYGGHQIPTGITSATTFALDGSGVVQAWVGQFGTTSQITKVRIHYSARTGTPPTYTVGLETVGTDGYPTGTYMGGGSPASVTFTPPADATWDGLLKEFTLANAFTPTLPSDMFALTIRYSSGTISASHCSTITQSAAGYNNGNRGLPYVARNSGTWAKVNTNPIFSLVTAGGVVLGLPYQSSYTTATANTAGHRCAKYFTLSRYSGVTLTVPAVKLHGKLSEANGSCAVKIWDTNGNVMATVTVLGNHQGLNNGAATGSRIFFDAPAVLRYGTKYYVGLQVITGTVYLSGIVCQGSDSLQAFPDGPSSGLATYDGSTWTENAAVYPLVDLLVSDNSIPPVDQFAGPIFQPMGRS